MPTFDFMHNFKRRVICMTMHRREVSSKSSGVLISSHSKESKFDINSPYNKYPKTEKLCEFRFELYESCLHFIKYHGTWTSMKVNFVFAPCAQLRGRFQVILLSQLQSTFRRGTFFIDFLIFTNKVSGKTYLPQSNCCPKN